MLGRHWLLKIMLWSGGAVNLRSDFGRHYAIFLTWSLGRNILASCDWIRAVLSSFGRGRWELSNDAKTAWTGCLHAELWRKKVLEKKYEIVLAEINDIYCAYCVNHVIQFLASSRHFPVTFSQSSCNFQGIFRIRSGISLVGDLEMPIWLPDEAQSAEFAIHLFAEDISQSIPSLFDCQGWGTKYRIGDLDVQSCLP